MNEINEGSFKSLHIQMQFSGLILSSGTGFIVDSNNGPVLITNRHNVTGRHQDTGECLNANQAIPNEVVISHNSSIRDGEWVRTVEGLYNEEDNPLWIEHPNLGSRADFVALPLTKLENVRACPYDVNGGSSMEIGVADIVSVVGFPFGLTAGGFYAIWATGFIASELTVNYGDLPVFLIDCRSRPGQSGSAVVASRNSGLIYKKDQFEGEHMDIYFGNTTKFLGIYSGRINNESDLGMVWKSSAIKELVDSVQ